MIRTAIESSLQYRESHSGIAHVDAAATGACPDAMVIDRVTGVCTVSEQGLTVLELDTRCRQDDAAEAHSGSGGAHGREGLLRRCVRLRLIATTQHWTPHPMFGAAAHATGSRFAMRSQLLVAHIDGALVSRRHPAAWLTVARVHCSECTMFAALTRRDLFLKV